MGVLPVLIGSFILNFPQVGSWLVGTNFSWLDIIIYWYIPNLVRTCLDSPYQKNITFVPILFAVFGLIFGCLLHMGYIAPCTLMI